jgi:DEAD/DEAH box helicase domain-containing protein
MGDLVPSIKLYDTAPGGAGFVGQAAPVLPELLRQAAKRLDCRESCDGACQACLLSFETAHRANEIDRRLGLQVLDVQFLSALELPDSLRCFGDQTLLELDDTILALLREARGASHIRVVLAGDPSTWDITEWSVWRHIQNWAAQQVAVELLFEAKVLVAADALIKNRLAGLIKNGLVTAYAVSSPSLARGTGFLLAEVVAGGRTTSFATTSVHALGLDEGWGANDRGQTLRVQQDRAVSIDEFEGTQQLTAASLEQLPPGMVEERWLAEELNGPLQDVGAKLLLYLRAMSSTKLDEMLARNVPLQRVLYEDRYLFTPLTMAVLGSVLQALLRVRNGAEWPIIDVITQTPKTSGFDPLRRQQLGRYLGHEWDPTVNRADLFAAYCPQIGVPNVSWTERKKFDTNHRRSLRLEWADGSSFRLLLDEGVGFVQTDRQVAFDFTQPVAKQAIALAALDNVGVKNRAAQTSVYVSRVLGPGEEGAAG